MLCVLFAAIFDACDGRIARMTGATSRFGCELDSLADVVSFGAAPAFILYCRGLGQFGMSGWLPCLALAPILAEFSGFLGNIEAAWLALFITPAIAGLMISTWPTISGKSLEPFPIGLYQSDQVKRLAHIYSGALPYRQSRATPDRVRGRPLAGSALPSPWRGWWRSVC